MSAWTRDGTGCAVSFGGAEPGIRGSRVDHGDASDNVYSQDGQELNISVGVC